MDPLSVAASAAGLASLAFSLVRGLHSGVEPVRSVETTLQAFSGEISTLAKSLELVDGELRDFALRGLDARNSTSISQVLNSLKNVLTDCEDTLVKLDKVIQEASKSFRNTVFRRSGATLKLNFKSTNIASPRQQINSYNSAMQTTVHILTISLVLSQSQPSTQMQSRLANSITSLEASKNNLRSRIATFEQPDPDDTSQPKVNNFSRYLLLSESVLSSASVYMGGLSGSAVDDAHASTHKDESGIRLGAEQRTLIESWTGGQSSDAPEEEDFNTSLDNRCLELVAKKIDQGEHLDAEKLLRTVLANAENSGDRPGYQILEAKIMLAVCHHDQNKFQEAIDQLLPLLDSKDLSEEQLSHLNSRLAESYLAMDKRAEAEVYMDDLPPSYRSRLTTPTTSTDNPQKRSILLKSDLKLFASRVVGGRLKMSLNGHQNLMSCIAFSRDGHFIASGSFDNTVKIWNAMTGKEARTLKGHNNPITSIQFTPDCKSIVSGSHDKTVNIWDVATGKLSRTLKGHKHYVTSIALSSDGNMVASASWDKTIRLWEFHSGKLNRTLAGHDNDVNIIAFSPKGHRIVSGSDDLTVKLWDSRTGMLETTLKEYTNIVTAVAFSHNGRYLASGSLDSSLEIWDMETKKVMITINNTEPVLAVTFSLSDADIVFTRLNGGILCHHLVTGKMTTLRKAGPECAYHLPVCFSPDGRTIACGSADKNDGRVEIWELECA